MNDQILIKLKRKLDDLSAYGQVGVETQRNALKEELQFYVLNFIYHHPKYSNWVMYGGSALRICHDLDRMSVDLDFEVSNPVSKVFLDELREEIETYFKDTYGTGSEFLTIKITTGRGLLLRFHIREELGIRHPSKQVHVKIDLNHFIVPKTVIERWPINHDQLSFVIKIYNMSSLMASKIAAIFLRGQRGVGKEMYEEKGRDIYDLLWYMAKKVIPDLDYLVAKGIDAKDLQALFNRLTLQMNKVNNTNLKQDLRPLFIDQRFIENWLKNWLESYFRLLDGYEIHTVTDLHTVALTRDSNREILGFDYYYATEEGSTISIKYSLSDYWIDDREGELTIAIDDDVVQHMTVEVREAKGRKVMKQKQYATLFYQKTERYLKRTNRIVLGDTITTKLIRMTADNLNQKEQIVLNKSALLSCELDDLFK